MQRTYITFTAIFLSLMGMLPSPAQAHIPVAYLGSGGQNGEPTLAPLLSRVTPAVVNIAVRGHVAMQSNPLLNDPFFQQFFNVPEMPASVLIRIDPLMLKKVTHPPFHSIFCSIF
jgi:S1-C subfamily serine protease